MCSAQSHLRFMAYAFLAVSTSAQAQAQSAWTINHISDFESWTRPPSQAKACTRAPINDDGLPNNTSKREGAETNCEDFPRLGTLRLTSRESAAPSKVASSQSNDSVAAQLLKMGKPGKKILIARQRVLELLEAQNACSEWYALRDANPAATFRTIGYLLDFRGEQYVDESREEISEVIYRNPYVASVTQDAGPYATITLNVYGAFFRLVGQAIERPKEGGSPKIGGFKMMGVGPYQGDSLKAQMLALLHEFGHVLDLLPLDFNNVDGKSVQNSLEVLRHCRAEIEAPAKKERIHPLEHQAALPY